jgi:hypothetical protein
MEGVINLDLVRDLRDTDKDGTPLRPGFRRDNLTGEMFYSSKWEEKPISCVGEIPEPDPEDVQAAEHARTGEPLDPEGAAVIARQLRSRPEDGYIGPRRTMLGMIPTVEDQVRHAAGMLVGSVRGAQRCADRLAEVAGVQSPIRTNAEGAARALARLAARVERDVAST